MKILYLSFIFLFSGLLTKSQSRPEPMLFAHIDTVYSDILKEKRPVWIYSPAFDTTYFSKPRYPVLYVLDGDGYFSSLVTMIQQLSVVNGNTVLPEMIIVGIPNLPGKRMRDLTTSPSTQYPGSGGGEAFTSFLQEELIPYVDQHYATAPYRMLMGHSLGALLTLNTLLKHAPLFSAYMVLDPSMSYAQQELLRQTPVLLEQHFQRKNLFLGIANTMNHGMDTLLVRVDTTALTLHIRSILKLKDNLQLTTANGLKWKSCYYPDDDHASMPMIAAYDGLRFIFSSNRFPRNPPQNQYLDKGYTAAQLKALIDQHYQALSAERGYQVNPPEPLMNQMAYTFLQQKDYERAEMFFQTNLSYYPESFNAYDGMGDYFLAIGEKKKAVTYFKAALKLKSTEEIRDKLARLKHK